MPYGELQPDGSVAVFNDDGSYIGTESWEQNQGLESGGLADQQQNVPLPSGSEEPSAQVEQWPEQRADGSVWWVAYNPSTGKYQDVYQISPPTGGAPGSTTEPTNVGTSTTIQLPNGGRVYASNGKWWGSHPQYGTQSFNTEAEARNWAQTGTGGGPGTGAGNPTTNLGGSTGGSTGGKTVAQMRAELLAHGDPRWATASDSEVIAEYNRLSGGGTAPQSTNPLAGQTITGGGENAQLAALLAQQMLQAQLDKERLYGRDIPQLYGYVRDPYAVQQARWELYQTGGDQRWFQVTDAEAISEFLKVASQDHPLRQRLLNPQATLERQQIEGTQTGYYGGQPTLAREGQEFGQLTSLANIFQNPRSFVPALQLGAAMGLKPNINWPGMESILGNVPLPGDRQPFQLTFGAGGEGGPAVPYPTLSPAQFGNPQTTNRLGADDLSRIASLVEYQGNDPNAFMAEARRYFPQANVSTATRYGV